ncbi:hypothetical protein [Shigella sp. FC1967]
MVVDEERSVSGIVGDNGNVFYFWISTDREIKSQMGKTGRSTMCI